MIGLFSGIGGFELGFSQEGFEVISVCEIEPFCQELLKKRFPQARLNRDIRSCSAEDFLAKISQLRGDKRAWGGARSGLWKEFRRAIKEVRPDFIVIENVSHTWRKWVPVVRRDLAKLGYSSLPLRVQASDLGAPHRRARIFIVAHADGEQLRKLSRWWLGKGRQVARELVGDGDAQYVANASSIGRREEHLQRAGGAKGSSSQRSIGCRPALGSASKTLADADGSRLEERREQSSREKFSTVERSRVSQRGRWAVEPFVGRVAHGVPARVDRLKSLGNAIVPQIAQIIARGIKEVCEIGY